MQRLARKGSIARVEKPGLVRSVRILHAECKGFMALESSLSAKTKRITLNTLGVIEMATSQVQPRITQPGSDDARKGVSLQEQLAALLANPAALALIQGMVPAATATTESAPVKGKGKGKGKPAAPVAAAPVAPDPAKWYLDSKKGLERRLKGTNARYFNVEMKTVTADSGIMIAQNNSREYGDVILLINSKRKPVYLRASQFCALVESFGMLSTWFKKHAEYIEHCVENPFRTSDAETED